VSVRNGMVNKLLVNKTKLERTASGLKNELTIAATKTTSGDSGVVNRVGRQDSRDGPHFLGTVLR
jgi:hypothetical protein